MYPRLPMKQKKKAEVCASSLPCSEIRLSFISFDELFFFLLRGSPSFVSQKVHVTRKKVLILEKNKAHRCVER